MALKGLEFLQEFLMGEGKGCPLGPARMGTCLLLCLLLGKTFPTAVKTCLTTLQEKLGLDNVSDGRGHTLAWLA